MRPLLFFFILCIGLNASYLSDGMDHENKGEMREAFKEYKKAARYDKSPIAFFKLGVIYFQGEIVKRDMDRAVEYFKESANRGYTKAKYDLGVIYANRKYRYYDRSKAFKYFLEAANEGHASAMNRVGMFYMEGKGGSEKANQLEAFRWFRKASNAGDLAARCHLALQYMFGIGTFENKGYAKVLVEPGYRKGIPICKKIWRENKLWKYKKSEQYKFFQKPR